MRSTDEEAVSFAASGRRLVKVWNRLAYLSPLIAKWLLLNTNQQMR
jgi:hypothetical protein